MIGLTKFDIYNSLIKLTKENVKFNNYIREKELANWDKQFVLMKIKERNFSLGEKILEMKH